MISHLEIKGFKSLVDVSIDLGAVNVFIGANGSGKSNLLEAVGFLSSIFSGGPAEEPLRYRGVRRGTPLSYRSSLKIGSPETISLYVDYPITSYSVRIAPDQEKEASWRIRNESLKVSDKLVFVSDENGLTLYNDLADGAPYLFSLLDDKSESRIKYAAFYQGLDVVRLPDGNTEIHVKRQINKEKLQQIEEFIGALGHYAIYTPSTHQLRGSRTDIQRVPLGLGGSGLSQAIDEMLKMEPGKLGPFDLDDVYELIDWADSLSVDEMISNGEAIRLRIGDRFMGNGHKTISLLEASEGALYVLFMLALVGHQESPKIFAVDNFDQALHPRLARALTRLVSEQIVDDGSRQMLATTHNPLVLDGLDILDDRIRLFTVDRDTHGATRIDRVMVSEELMAQADEGLSLSQLWVMGRLGGVPKYF